MKFPAHLLAILAILAGCQPGTELDVKVFAPNRVQLSLQGDSADACIENLRIVPKGATADAPAIWEIELIETAHPTDAETGGIVITEPRGDCVQAVSFPQVPPGYELVSRSPVTALPAGSYWVTGHAYQYWLSGDFQIPLS